MDVETRYVLSGDAHIAYQVVGEGPLDLVLVPAWLSHLELIWEWPGVEEILTRLASFARLILFDRRGAGLSEGVAGVPLEQQIDDVRAVLAATGAERPAVIALNEGCALAVLFAASLPDVARALVLWSPMARAVSGPGYGWPDASEVWAERTDAIIVSWGRPDGNSLVLPSRGADPLSARQLARLQRFCMGPGAARATRDTTGATDVRDVLPSIQCPTLVMRRSGDEQVDARHARYVADHVPGARLTELPGSESLLFRGDREAPLAEIEHFLTGTTRPVVSDRVLATVLFTDIVRSTERAAQLGDGPWRELLVRHDAVVREAVERHRGRVVKSLGDGALAVFDGPSRAITSALAISEGARELGIEVRAGLHTGECELLPGDDVGGLAVHVGARVCALAGPGEVLVSGTVCDLVAGSGLEFDDRGEQELKGVPGASRVYAVR